MLYAIRKKDDLQYVWDNFLSIHIPNPAFVDG